MSSLPAASKVNVAAMVVAIVGIVVQIAAGVDHPPIPPGPIILAAAAALVVLTRRRWAAIVIVSAFLTIGGTIAFLADDDLALRRPESHILATKRPIVTLAAHKTMEPALQAMELARPC